MKVRFAVSVGIGPPDPQYLGAVVGAAEQRGFDSLWLSDVPSLSSTDPTIGVAYAAAVTDRVHLGINFIPFGATPYVVAHRLAQLDRITNGRLLVTLVPGLDLPGEREALGTAGRHRGRMMDEIIPQLRELWGGGLPVPPVQDPLEIWLGGSGPEAVARAGRLADGWLGSLVSPRRAGQIVQGIQEAATAAGREIDSEHFGLSIGYARDSAGVEAAARTRVRAIRPRRPDLDPVDPAELVPVGRDALRRLLAELVDQGLSKFVVRSVAPTGDLAAWETELDWLAGTILDLQT
ncbi:MAG TPA: LLM class flavin-dependent oxidoreductase [Acidimicrobiales bacterium]|jgi:probable F420-dependent oxidoreductase|nr:LLM class flavin-dependent oxidoreductase [Acidimicrobiales bacterium]